MSVIVKICGLSTEETVDAAVAAGADMIGLNFFPKSPRYVAIPLASALARRARGKSQVVALGVDMDDATLTAIVDGVRPDWLQLHGGEPPERVEAVRRMFGVPVMKAVGVRTADDVAAALGYAEAADGLLLDAKPPKGSERPGGNAVSFDWTLVRNFDPGKPWLLSGGLDPQNVGTAIAVSGAAAVDVSSGVESALGRKDPDLIRAFVAAARASEAAPEQRIAS